jgi:hypothetical protein
MWIWSMQEAAFHVRLRDSEQTDAGAVIVRFRSDVSLGSAYRGRPRCTSASSEGSCVRPGSVRPQRRPKKKSCGPRGLRAGFVRSRPFFSCQRYIVVGRLFSEPRSARHRRAIGVRLRERLEPPSNLHQPCLVSLQACMFHLAPPNRHWAAVSLQVKLCC